MFDFDHSVFLSVSDPYQILAFWPNIKQVSLNFLGFLLQSLLLCIPVSIKNVCVAFSSHSLLNTDTRTLHTVYHVPLLSVLKKVCRGPLGGRKTGQEGEWCYAHVCSSSEFQIRSLRV